MKQVLDEGVSFLANEVLFEGGFGASDSLLASRVSSLLAVPVVTAHETLGLIYLDTTDPQARFDEGQLELLTGIAGIAAAALDNARRFERLEGDRRRLQTEIDVRHNMVGASSGLRAVLEFIARVAPTNSTVLIRGESGTGKELVARAIHRNSPRAAGPFVAINCAALTETLLESEVFGHERGAFTGAVALKKGKLEEAEGGSLFLDEVGELAPALQVKLLRVLQEREFQRLGGTRTIKADIRLIAATNRDLEEAVRTGGFRRDLYYRVNVVSVTVPPLHDRKQDIPLLANYFAQKHSRNVGRWVAGVSREAQRVLLNYDWPGNIRELENALERAVVLGSTETILPEDLPEHILEVTPVEEAAATCFHEAVREAKRRIVLANLEQAGGNYTEAARLLGLHPSNLHRLIRQLDLRSGLRRQ
jgi:Nif-specific regulatory protein